MTCSLKPSSCPFAVLFSPAITNLPLSISFFLTSIIIPSYFPSFLSLQGAILTTLLVTRNFSGMFLTACHTGPGPPNTSYELKVSIKKLNKITGGFTFNVRDSVVRSPLN